MLDEIVNKSRPDRVQGLTQARVVPQVGKGIVSIHRFATAGAGAPGMDQLGGLARCSW